MFARPKHTRTFWQFHWHVRGVAAEMVSALNAVSAVANAVTRTHVWILTRDVDEIISAIIGLFGYFREVPNVPD